jgi:hypothetical protein
MVPGRCSYSGELSRILEFERHVHRTDISIREALSAPASVTAPSQLCSPFFVMVLCEEHGRTRRRPNSNRDKHTDNDFEPDIFLLTSSFAPTFWQRFCPLATADAVRHESDSVIDPQNRCRYRLHTPAVTTDLPANNQCLY